MFFLEKILFSNLAKPLLLLVEKMSVSFALVFLEVL